MHAKLKANLLPLGLIAVTRARVHVMKLFLREFLRPLIVLLLLGSTDISTRPV
jgi:hypothetical protein